MKITPISESAVVCTLSPPASLEQQRQLWAFASRLQSDKNIVEVIVGMNNLTVFTDFITDFASLIQRLEQCWQTLEVNQFQGHHIDIPVMYGGEFGQDLYDVAKYHQTTAQHIVELPESLHTPRRATPRTEVPAGSVGIGGAQTGIYPFSSPGGWQLIGHTKQALFDKNQEQPTLLQAGDTVRFVVEGIEL